MCKENYNNFVTTKQINVMKNNRKNRNAIKISNRNLYRIKRVITTKSYFKMSNESSTDLTLIDYAKRELLLKCNSAAIRELNKWGLKSFYLKENKIDYFSASDGDDFVRDRFTILTSVKYDIKFLN